MEPRKLTQAQLDGLAKGRATRAANLEKRKAEPTTTSESKIVVKPRKSLKQENQKLKDAIKVCEDALESVQTIGPKQQS
jgi:hypothetical protein